VRGAHVSRDEATMLMCVRTGNAIFVSVISLAIVWNCACHQGFDETPVVYVLAVERQTLIPSLPIKERGQVANACFSQRFSSLWRPFFTRECRT
jgi:hypothetical protein